MKFQMENESILLVLWVGRLLLLSPFRFNCQTCLFKLTAEVGSIPCPVRQVVVEFFYEEDVVLTVGIFFDLRVISSTDRLRTLYLFGKNIFTF